jgi:beta-phosphoglucomutase-like phosphatase (HAD superfamily)
MKLVLPPGNFKAYLFDCDGTIADSMPLHFLAWSRALGEQGCVFDEETFYAWGGRSVADIIAKLNHRDSLDMPVDLVEHRKEEIYYESLPSLRCVPEVLEQIEFGYGRIPMAVVSGSKRESVVASLTALNLLDRFDTLVCAGDYQHGKPDPEPFLLAAERLGVAPGDCLVFEDADLGIASARAAGMASVRILQPWERAAAVKAAPSAASASA